MIQRTKAVYDPNLGQIVWKRSLTMTADWLEILRTAVAQRGQKPVAAELGYSRTTISLVLAGKYAGKTDAVASRCWLFWPR
jgi:hypothetical protein